MLKQKSMISVVLPFFFLIMLLFFLTTSVRAYKSAPATLPESPVSGTASLNGDSVSSISQNGITVSIERVITERTGVYVIYSVTADADNVRLDDDMTWECASLDVSTTDVFPSAAVIEKTILEQSECHRLEMLTLVSSAPIIDGTIKLTLEDLIYNQSGAVITGNWSMEWVFTLEDTSKILTAEQITQQSEVKQTISEIVISPSAISIVEVGEHFTFSEADDTVYVNFRDGKQVGLSVHDGVSCAYFFLIDDEEGMMQKNTYFSFKNAIDPKEVASLTFRNYEIPCAS